MSTSSASTLTLAPSQDEVDVLLAGVQADAVGVIAAVEAIKARLDAVALAAWASLCATYSAAAHDTGWRPSDVESLARSGTVAEVMAATGLGEGECWRRLSLAVAEPERTAPLQTALTTGTATLALSLIHI